MLEPTGLAPSAVKSAHCSSENS